MGTAADAQQYAMLGVEEVMSDDSLTPEQRALIVLGPILSAFIHFAERAAERLGTDRATLLAEIREEVCGGE